MVLDMSFVMRKVQISKDSIDKFYIYDDERRQIRSGKVKSIRKSFDQKSKVTRHFDSPLVVNEANNHYNTIDGNHRIDAIKEKLAADPDFKINVWCAVYRGLTREQEREVYSKWNKGTPESATDFLKWHFKVIPYGQKMLDELPVEVYSQPKKMSLKLLMGSYILAKSQKKFSGSYGVGGESCLADLMEITPRDIQVVKAWYADMKEVFGEFYAGNPFYYSTPVTALFRIWYDNKDIPRAKFLKIWKSVFADKQRLWVDQCKMSGRDACKMFYRNALLSLNDARKLVHWKSDVEILSAA